MARLQSTKKVVTSANNTTLAYGSNLTAGSLLCVTQSHFVAPGASISTPVDTLTHTYAPMTAEQSWTSGGDLNALRGYYVANSLSGADTVTFDIVGVTTGDLSCVIAEYSGMATASPLDVTAVGAGTSTAVVTAATGTTAQADELCWGGMTMGGLTTTITETGGYAVVQQDPNGSSNMPIACEDKTVASVATYTASWTLGASRQFVCFVATFKVAGAAAGLMIPRRRQGRPFPFKPGASRQRGQFS